MHTVLALLVALVLAGVHAPAGAQEPYRLGAHTGWPWVEELMSVCYKWENVWFGINEWMPKYLKPEIVNFIGSRMGQDRAVWGTNGLPWKESLDQVDGLGLKPEARRKLIHDNARELFRL